jgi:branched-chain amino acid transport system substrate-binding protein
LRCIATLLVSLSLSLPAQAEILIGVAGPLTGPNTSFGNELRVGANAAVAAVNAAGGINGETLAVVEGDDGCDAKRAVDVAKTFVSRDVRMVVGHFCSSASLAAAATYNAAGVLMFNPSVTTPDLTSKNLWNVFRLTGRDDAQGEIAATRIKATGQASAVYIITDGQADSASLTKRFLTTIPDSKVINVKAGSVKLPEEPGLIVASAVYLALQAPDAADAAKALRTLNPTAKFYGPDFLQSENFSTRGEAAANGTRVSFLQDNLSKSNISKLTTLPQTDGATLAAYAAVEVFVAAAKARSVNDTRAMASFLTSGGETATIIGPLRFNASGDLQQQPYVWYTWTNGVLAPESP